MKHTVRALLAVGLLLGVYVLAAVVVAGMGGLVYLAATAGSGAAAVKVGIVAVLVALALGKGVVSSLRTPPLEEHGVALTPEAQPRLWSEVRALAGQVGVRAPDEIRLLPEVNAAVSEQSRWLGLTQGRRTMYIGAPLLIGLSTDQMRSVLAHEFGHYSGRHTALAGVSYRGLEAIRRMIANLGPDSWVGKLFRLYGRLYLAVSHSVNRRQELEADRFSAEVAGRQSAIAAMRELPVIGQAWTFFIEAYASLGQARGQRPEAMLAGFQQLWSHPERQGQLAQVRASEPDESRTVYDTHPSTAERIRAFEALPDDGRSDHSGPALDLLESPGAAMADLERWMFEESALTGVSWDRLVSESGAATAAEAASTLTSAAEAGAVESATLGAILEALRAARAHALVAPLVTDGATADQRSAAAAHFVGQAIVASLVQTRGADYRVDWGGPWQLVASSGAELDPWPLVEAAVASPDGVPPLEAWMAAHDVPLDFRAEPAGSTKSARRASARTG